MWCLQGVGGRVGLQSPVYRTEPTTGWVRSRADAPAEVHLIGA